MNLNKFRVKYFIQVLAIFYFVALLYVVFLLPRRFGNNNYRQFINKDLFHEKINFLIYSKVHDVHLEKVLLIDILGNLILLMPFALAIQVISNRIYKTNHLITGVVLLSFAIELLQYILNMGVADIDDWFLNSLGGVIGVIAVKIKKNKYKKVWG